MTRLISHSEVSAALDCQLRHAFAYTGQATSQTVLKPKATHLMLRQGRAWGAAVAAFHAASAENAHVALTARLSLDAAQQQQHGIYDEDEHINVQAHLHTILDDYTATTDRLAITRLEHELDVAIPSRTGRRRSTVYRLLAFVDGIHTDEQGREFLVEFKLRKQFQSADMIAKNRQTRWYAWAYEQVTGREPAGVIVDERLNQAPAPVKLNKDGTPSKVQSCRLDEYVSAWIDLDRQPDEETVVKLAAKAWQQRHTILFSPREITEAGQQLVSAAHLISMLDTGALFPIRNPSPVRCPGCAYRDICQTPDDDDLIDALYDRAEPKRNQGMVPVAA